MTNNQTVEFRKRSTTIGTAIFVVDYVIFCALLYGALCASNAWLQLSFGVGAGISIGLLFVVGHDAGHQSLTPHRWLNNVLGRLALLPAVHPYSLWILVHNQTHHRWTNLCPKDYVWNPLTMEQYRSRGPLGRAQYRFYRSWAGPLAYYFVEFWIKRIMFPSRKEVRGTYKSVYIFDMATVAICVVGYLSWLSVGGQQGWFNGHSAWNSLLFGAVVPFATWNTLMSFVVYLHHTHPELTWYDDEEEWDRLARQSETAVHVIFPGPINLIFHWIMEHNAHHAQPSIPLYNLKAAQAELATDEERIVEFRWTPLAHLDVVRRCKLYDFEAKRWMDFQGNYTSESTKQPEVEIQASESHMYAPYPTFASKAPSHSVTPELTSM